MESTSYEEDLQQNRFLLGLQKRANLSKLFDAAFSAGDAVLCVPKSSSLPPTKVFMHESFLSDHLLLPYDLDTGHFGGEQCTFTNGEHFIHVSSSQDSSISVYDQFPSAPVTRAYSNLEQYFDTTLPPPLVVVKVLFEETYYNDAFQSVRLQCVDSPLRVSATGKGTSPSVSGLFEVQNSGSQLSQFGSGTIVSTLQPAAKNLAVSRIPNLSSQHQALLTTNFLNAPLRQSAQHPHVLTTHVSSLPDLALLLQTAFQSASTKDGFQSSLFANLIECRSVEEHKEFIKYVLGAKEAKQCVFKHPSLLYFVSEYTIAQQGTPDADKTNERAQELQKIAGIIFDDCMFALQNGSAGRSKVVAQTVQRNVSLQRELHLAVYCCVAHMVQEDVFHWLHGDALTEWTAITSNIETLRLLRVSDTGISGDLLNVLDSALPVGFAPAALLLGPEGSDLVLLFEAMRRKAVAKLVGETSSSFVPFSGIPDWVPSGIRLIGTPIVVDPSEGERPEPGYYRGGKEGAEMQYSRYYYVSVANQDPAVLRSTASLGFLGGNSVDGSGQYTVNSNAELVGNQALLRCWRCKRLIERRCVSCERELGQQNGINAKKRLDSLLNGKGPTDTPEWGAMVSPPRIAQPESSRGVFDSDSDDMQWRQKRLQERNTRCMPSIALPLGADPQQCHTSEELSIPEPIKEDIKEEPKDTELEGMDHSLHTLKGPNEVAPVFAPPFGFAAIHRLFSLPYDVSTMTSLEVTGFFHEVYQLLQWDVMARWKYADELAKSKFGGVRRESVTEYEADDTTAAAVSAAAANEIQGATVIEFTNTADNDATLAKQDNNAEFTSFTRREAIASSGGISTEQSATSNQVDDLHTQQTVEGMRFEDEETSSKSIQVLVVTEAEAERRAKEARRNLHRETAEPAVPSAFEQGSVDKKHAFGSRLLQLSQQDQEDDSADEEVEDEVPALPTKSTTAASPQPLPLRTSTSTPRGSISQLSSPKEAKLYITADDMLPLLCYVIVHACDLYKASRLALIQDDAQSYAHVHAELSSDPFALCSGASTAVAHALQIECPTLRIETRELPIEEPPFLSLALAYASAFQPPAACVPARVSAAQLSVAHFCGALQLLAAKDSKFLAAAQLRNNLPLLQRLDEGITDTPRVADVLPSSRLQERLFDVSDQFSDVVFDTPAPQTLREPTRELDLDGLFDEDPRGTPEVAEVLDVHVQHPSRRRRAVHSALDAMLPSNLLDASIDPLVLDNNAVLPGTMPASPGLNRALNVLDSDELDPLGINTGSR